MCRNVLLYIHKYISIYSHVIWKSLNTSLIIIKCSVQVYQTPIISTVKTH